MKIAKINRPVRFYQNNFPVPILLKGGERYVMSDFVMVRLGELTHKGNVKEETGEWSFNNRFKQYKGEDLTDKTLLAWRTGGIGDFCWISAAARTLKNKYENFHFIMACAPQYKPLVEACGSFDETFVLPFPAKLLARTQAHQIFENAVENNKRAEQINAYDLFGERFYLNWQDPKEYPVEFKRPYLIPQEKAVDKVKKLFEYIGCDPTDGSMKIGVQVKTSSPIRTPDFGYMITLIKVLKERWPNAWIFIFDSPAMTKRVQDAIDAIKLPRVINWLRIFKDLSVTIALIKELDLTIAPDSSVNHISAAFDVPNVGIFGGFHPHMRSLYYPYSDWVTANYNKWKCGPCWRHSDESCEFSQGAGITDHAICLDEIRIHSIMERVDRVLDLKALRITRWEDDLNDAYHSYFEGKVVQAGYDNAQLYNPGAAWEERRKWNSVV